MSGREPFVPTPRPDTLPLPMPLIVVIAIGCYMFIIVVGLVIKQCLQSRGICGECRCCGREEEQTCQCCLVLGQTCNCFECKGVNTTLNKCFPRKVQVDCVDIILCQCCAPDSGRKEPLCGAQCCNGCNECTCLDSILGKDSLNRCMKTEGCSLPNCCDVDAGQRQRPCCESTADCDCNCGCCGHFLITPCVCCECQPLYEGSARPPEPGSRGHMHPADYNYHSDFYGSDEYMQANLQGQRSIVRQPSAPPAEVYL